MPRVGILFLQVPAFLHRSLTLLPPLSSPPPLPPPGCCCHVLHTADGAAKRFDPNPSSPPPPSPSALLLLLPCLRHVRCASSALKNRLCFPSPPPPGCCCHAQIRQMRAPWVCGQPPPTATTTGGRISSTPTTTHHHPTRNTTSSTRSRAEHGRARGRGRGPYPTHPRGAEGGRPTQVAQGVGRQGGWQGMRLSVSGVRAIQVVPTDQGCRGAGGAQGPHLHTRRRAHTPSHTPHTTTTTALPLPHGLARRTCQAGPGPAALLPSLGLHLGVVGLH